MGACIASLRMLGWVPAKLNWWHDETGQVWALDEQEGLHEFREVLAKSAAKVLWARSAQQSWNGGGLQRGPATDIMQKHFRKVQSKDPDKANRLLRLWAGGFWDAHRKGLAYQVDDLCEVCKRRRGSAFHYFWMCMPHVTAEQGSSEDTDHLAALAKEQYLTLPCRWMRGVLLEDALRLHSRPKESQEFWRVGRWPKEFPAGGALCVDGSGGRFGATPRLRRVGWAVVLVAPGGAGALETVAAVYGPLAAEQVHQTVPRAEIFAATVAFQVVLSKNWLDVAIYSDHKAVVDMLQRGSWRKKSRNTAPLAMLLRKADQARAKVIKVPSHVDKKADKLAKHMDLPDVAFVGNEVADLFAGKGAEMHQAEQMEKQHYDEDLAKWKLVCERMDSLVCRVYDHREEQRRAEADGSQEEARSGTQPEEADGVRPIRVGSGAVVKPGFGSIAAQSRHRIRVTRNGISCIRCWACCNGSEAIKAKFMESSCPFAEHAMGWWCFHATHAMRYDIRNVDVVCMQCGIGSADRKRASGQCTGRQDPKPFESSDHAAEGLEFEGEVGTAPAGAAPEQGQGDEVGQVQTGPGVGAAQQACVQGQAAAAAHALFDDPDADPFEFLGEEED